MDLSRVSTDIIGIPVTTSIYEVFDHLHHHPEWPFLVILDNSNIPIGVIREWDLKPYVYMRFGRELIKRHTVMDLLTPTTCIPINTSKEELLNAASKNPNPDGILLLENGVYKAALLSPAILDLFKENHKDSQLRLAQAQKMEALGTLAGGIAHDLNNVLTPILGYTELIKIAVNEGEKVELELLDDMKVSIKRASQIVGQILSFSRHHRTECSNIQLNNIIREVVGLMRISIPSSIDIEFENHSEEDNIYANQSEIHQVLMNLCTNAYHAMKEKGGILRIILSTHSGPVTGWSMSTGPFPNKMLRLSVSDTGTGIKADVLPKIFDPFFTTKPKGEGTGMGLAMAHGIINRYNGAISIETAVGEGTTFHIYLPLAKNLSITAEAPLTASPSVIQPLSDRRNIRALFVDDEFHITQMAKRLLPKYGISVITENDSKTALSLIESNINDFDVLITDQTMPAITGLQLAAKAMSLKPSIPVVLCTGYTDIKVEDTKTAGIMAYMFKPVDYKEMAEMIHKWADTSSNINSRPDVKSCSQKRIVIVEDDKNLLKLYARTLPAYFRDHEILYFSDGIQAYNFLRINDANLIVLDINLPGMDANQILCRLRADSAAGPSSTSPILFYTGVARSLDKIETHCVRNRWKKMLKPFDMDRLVSTMKDLIDGGLADSSHPSANILTLQT